jgi:hypothetical protein
MLENKTHKFYTFSICCSFMLKNVSTQGRNHFHVVEKTFATDTFAGN